MKTSENINELATSLIKFQSEITNIAKDSKGYGYNYTSLEKLIEHARPLLAQNNLGFIQTPTNNDNKIGVTTRLIHTSGQYIEDTLLMDKSNLAKMNDYQVAGSIITYFRRYGLSSILGIASDEDVDANIKQEQPQQQVPKQVQKQKPQPKITQEQVLELEGLLSQHGKNKSILLNYYQLNSLSEINACNYEGIKKQVIAPPKK